MKLKLQQRRLKNGRFSLYLEYYKGYSKTKAGKIKHKREMENLNLYLHEFPKNAEQRLRNKENQNLAQKIFIKRQAEINDGKYGFNNEFKPNTNLVEYFSTLTEQRKNKQSSYSNWKSALHQIIKFCDPETTTFKDIDEDFIKRFKNFLVNDSLVLESRKLTLSSASSYFNKFKSCMKQAFEDRIIAENPARRIQGIKRNDPQKQYLTFEELEKLAKTDCRYIDLKKSFLFSCLTGLRYSDLQKMKWSEVHSFNEGHRIIFTQKKTNSLEYLDISKQARELLGEDGKPETNVFKGLRYNSYFNVALRIWCISAGITKHITFHSARHTFATLQLTLGTDIYTVSKLLGHKQLATTQVYSNIIDAKKIEAVNRIPELNFVYEKAE